jgi:hypothetical protein
MEEPNDVSRTADRNVDGDFEGVLVTIRSKVRDAIIVQCAVANLIEDDIYCEWSNACCAEIPRYSRVIAAVLQATAMPDEWRMNMAERQEEILTNNIDCK